MDKHTRSDVFTEGVELFGNEGRQLQDGCVPFSRRILKNEQARNEATMEQYTAGASIPCKKKKYTDAAFRIQRISLVNDFENREKLDF